MTKKHIIFIVTSIIIVCSYFFYLQKEDSISINLFEIDGGYGYEISSENHLFVRQENIPAIQENIPFCSKEDAEKTAKMVKRKIIKKQSPSISLEELRELKIKINCVDLQ